MEFTFDNKELKDICENEQIALQHFSFEIIMELQSCLAEIGAVKNLGELPEMLWNRPEKNENGSFIASFSLGNNGEQLFFIQNHIPSRQNHIDDSWLTVSRIRLLTISTKYYGGI